MTTKSAPAPKAPPEAAAEKPAEAAAEKPAEIENKSAQVAPPASIHLKLITILNEVGNVQKKGKNKAQDYEFVRETDLVEKIRPLMAREHLFLHITVIEHELREQGKTRSGSTNWLTILRVRFTWVNADTGETWQEPADFIGYGQDTGDKGVYKATTGAEKYFLFKTFLISTGDDPEGDEKVDRREAESGAAEGTRVTRRAATAGQGRGGKSTVPTSAQIRELWRLFGVAKLNAQEAVAFVTRVLEVDASKVDPKVQGQLLRFVQALKASQVGILIRTLSEETGDHGEEQDGDSHAAAPDAAPDDGAGREDGEAGEPDDRELDSEYPI